MFAEVNIKIKWHLWTTVYTVVPNPIASLPARDATDPISARSRERHTG